MSLFDKLFRSKTNRQGQKQATAPPVEDIQKREEENWKELPHYIEVDHENSKLVSTIIASIAAGDEQESKFEIAHVYEENPEAKLVSLIATSIAASNEPDSHFIVKKIYREI